MFENVTGWRKEMLDDMKVEYREKWQAEGEFKAAINMLKNGYS